MGIKLLFADDSATMQKVVQLALEHEDVALTIAGDGESAFEAAKREAPDVIMADVSMPGGDGFSLCGKLKADAGTAHIPIVLVTGEMEEYDDKKGRDAGAAWHITKPFKSGELLETIRKLAENPRGAAEKPAMLELLKPKAADDAAMDEDDMEVVALDSAPPLGNAGDLELNLDELDLQDLDAGSSPDAREKGVGQAQDSVVAASPQRNEAEGNPSRGGGDALWNVAPGDLGRDAEVDKAAVEASSAAVMGEPHNFERSEPSVEPAELERIFQELAEEAVREFMASRAPEIFREEMSKAIRDQVGGVIEARLEKAFHDEIGKMISESIGKAMPKMLAIMEKVTLQITPKIAEQMIKTAIEKIKGGEAR